MHTQNRTAPTGAEHVVQPSEAHVHYRLQYTRMYTSMYTSNLLKSVYPNDHIFLLSELNSQVPIESGKDTGRSGHRKKWTSNYLTQWCQRFWGETKQSPACLPPSSISVPNRDTNSGWNMMPVHIFIVDYSRFEKPRSYLEPNSPAKGSACLSQQEKLNAKIIRDNIKWLLPVNSRTTCTASRAA